MAETGYDLLTDVHTETAWMPWAEAMECDEQAGQDARDNREAVERPAKRPWTKRVAGPIRYERFTDYGPDGSKKIYFRFADQAQIDDAIYAIMDRHKRHPERNRDTGLHFRRDRYHGKVWVLPDHPLGRTVADSIDGQLTRLAERLERQQQSRSH